MKPNLLVLGLCSLLSLAIAAPAHAKAEKPDKAESGGKKKDGKKKKKKDKSKDENKEKEKTSPQSESINRNSINAILNQRAAKGGLAPTDEVKPTTWCDQIFKDTGLLYDQPENPWFQEFNIGGRFHYQAAHLSGSDFYGRDFHDNYDEYRRFRLETKTKFLKYFTAELNLNLVNDDRFKEAPDNELDWGYDAFDTATLQFNLGKAIGTGPLDSLKLTYGRMKIGITAEQRQSSNEIYTIERSLLSDRLAGDTSRPTGFTIDAEKGQWSATLGIFSGEDDADFIGAWNDGEAFFGSVTWQPTAEFHLTLDHITNHQSGADDAIGYHTATSLAAVYETPRWGIMADFIYGDNGYGDPTDSAKNRARRQGDFQGLIVMPWYWLIEDRLQLVFRYETATSELPEGLRASNRYLRAGHDDPLVELNGGRGDNFDSLYLGLNYHLCHNQAKIMGGVSYESMNSSLERNVKVKGPNYTVTDYGTFSALTYFVGFRINF